MVIDVYGDAQRLLEHFIHCSKLYPENVADAMLYNLDVFKDCLRCLDRAFREAQAEPERGIAAGRKKRQPTLPDDFDERFPDPIGGRVMEWLQYKTERKDFYSHTGLRNLLAQIDGRVKRHSAESVASLISECMSNNWAGIIWEKLERQDPLRQRSGRGRRLASREPSLWAGFLLGDHDSMR